jgi:hypothetical protein
MQKDDDERMSQGAQAAPGFVTVAEDVEPTAVVPLMLIESQERAKTQNEILDAGVRAGDVGGWAIEETFDHADGDVRDPRRTETVGNGFSRDHAGEGIGVVEAIECAT